MTTKEMREITNRHYKNLPEVQEKVIQRKAEEEKKTNRIMSQVFAQVLYLTNIILIDSYFQCTSFFLTATAKRRVKRRN
jgi:hypothetical protein